MAATFYLSNTVIDTSKYELQNAVPGSGTVAITVAKATTQTRYFITPANVPYTTSWTNTQRFISWVIASVGTSVTQYVRIHRVNSSGAIQASTSLINMGAASAGTFSQSFGGEIATGSIGDRWQVEFAFYNGATSSRTVTLNTASSSAYLYVAYFEKGFNCNLSSKIPPKPLDSWDMTDGVLNPSVGTSLSTLSACAVSIGITPYPIYAARFKVSKYGVPDYKVRGVLYEANTSGVPVTLLETSRNYIEASTLGTVLAAPWTTFLFSGKYGKDLRICVGVEIYDIVYKTDLNFVNVAGMLAPLLFPSSYFNIATSAWVLSGSICTIAEPIYNRSAYGNLGKRGQIFASMLSGYGTYTGTITLHEDEVALAAEILAGSGITAALTGKGRLEANTDGSTTLYAQVADGSFIPVITFF